MAQNFLYALVGGGGKPVDTSCSCTQCTNDKCLGMVRLQDNIQSCSCEDCTEPETCLLYDKNKSHSVGCGASADNNFILVADVCDGNESKFDTCCHGKSKLVAPGLVFELPKYCDGNGLSLTKKTNKFESGPGFDFPISATPKCESSGYKLELSKLNDNEGRNEKESPANAYNMLTKSIQKPYANINCHECCHTSVKNIYKSPPSVFEKRDCTNNNENKLPGIVYDLAKLAQSRKCNESAKIKSDSFVCKTVLPKKSSDCDQCRKRNESFNSRYGRMEPPTKKYSHENCHDSSKDFNLAKYMLNLRKKMSEFSETQHSPHYECNEYTRMNENESLRNSCELTKFFQKSQSQKNNHECCHDSALHKSESSICGLEPRKKSNIYLYNESSKRNGNESPDRTKWSPLEQTSSCTCHEPANNKYKSHTYGFEPLKPQAQKSKNGYCDSIKNKLEPRCALETQLNLHQQNDCGRNKFKKLFEYDLMKCSDCYRDSSKYNSVAKYVLDLRKKYSDQSISECHKCSRNNENDSHRNANEPKLIMQKLVTQKSSCDCFDSADYNSVSPGKDLLKSSQRHRSPLRENSNKSTRTCSSECCPKHEKKQYVECSPKPENSPTYRELMMSTSTLSQLCNRKSKDSMTDKRPCCQYQKKEGSKISSPDAMYAAMMDTLKKQESVVEIKKDAYLPDPKCKLSPAAVYAAMTEKQKQQNSVVEILKSTYLPQSSLTWDPNSKKKYACKYSQRPDRSKKTERIIPIVLSDHSQELVIKKQSFKEPDTKIAKCCDCKKGKASSVSKTSNHVLNISSHRLKTSSHRLKTSSHGLKTSSHRLKTSSHRPKISKQERKRSKQDLKKSQTSVVKPLETDYVTMCKERVPKKKLIVGKCTCKHKRKEKHNCMNPNEDIQIYWSTNDTSHNAGPLRNKQESPDYLCDIENCVQLPNILCKKDKKIDIKKQGSKENQIDIEYIPFMRPSCNSEPSPNALCTGFSNTDQNSNIVKCDAMSDISKTSSISKTKSAQEVEKNIQLFSINKLETKFIPDTMHIFYNTNSKRNEQIKNKFELPRYSEKSQQYKPTKNAQELFKNILQTHGDEIETLINRYQKKTGESNIFTKDIESKSFRNFNELPQSSLISIKQSESTRKNSQSSGGSTKLHSYRSFSHEPARNTKDFNINRCETKRITSFHCKNSTKQRNLSSGYECGSYIPTAQKKHENKNGYVLELPKYTNYSTTRKKPCKCHDSAKNKFESSGCITEQSKTKKHEKKKCECKNSAKHRSEKQDYGNITNSEFRGYVLDLPKYTQKCSSCNFTHIEKKPEDLSMLKLVSKSVQSDTENVCKHIAGTQTDTDENWFLRNLASEDTIDLCKDILKSQIHTIEVLKKIYFPQNKKTNSNRTFQSPQITYTPVQNSIEISNNINNSKRIMQPETAKLSAEVLAHIPYPELNDSSLSMKPTKVSKYDLIQKLKEAFKACSCKICECVTNKVAKPDACKCKPCECDECTNTFLSHETNEREICDCKPCDCAQCTKLLSDLLHNNLNQTNCSKTKGHQRQSIVVAPVEIDDPVSHVACTCSPCACIECGLVYPLGSTIINEMSTSTNRHALCRCDVCLNENCDQSGFGSCKCQMKNKIMSKPIDHDTHDFDIRAAMIVQNSPMSQRVCRNDPIAMFAALPNTYPNLKNKPSNTKTYICKEGECMFRVSEKDAINSFQLLSNTSRSKLDTYSSLNYETESLKYSSNEPHRFERYGYRNDTYGPCYVKETLRSVKFPFKKGDVLTPSTHKLKVQKQILQKQRLDTCCIPSATTNTSSSSNQQNFNICHELTTTELNTSNKIGSIAQANMHVNDLKTKYLDKRKTLKYDAYLYCQEINKKRSLYNNVALENVPVLEGCFSDHSSSYYKNTQSNSKCRKTFYNSSGRKYPEYVIQYSQKGTIETSLKDVTINETRRLDNFKLIPSKVEKHNIDKIYECTREDENGFKINHSDNELIETLRRKYKFGLNKNVCVQLSSTNENKNREIHEIQNKEINQLQGACLTGSRYPIEINSEKCEYFKAINDVNEIHVAHKIFDRNMSARHSLTLQDEHSDLITSTEILNTNDYRRVTNTLNEAREFSQELTRLLKKYEKANNEFQSISDKLKLSHENLFSSDFVRRFSSHTQKQHKQ